MPRGDDVRSPVEHLQPPSAGAGPGPRTAADRSYEYRKRSSGAEMPGPGTPFEKLRETGFIVCGDPDYVAEWLANDMRTAGYGHFMGMFRMGKIDHEYVMKSKKLFAEQVMPKLKDINVSVQNAVAG